jgi:ATP-dependent Clp protease ATP-binding subunit ClpC
MLFERIALAGRFTQESCALLGAARGEAARLGSPAVGTEHVLFAFAKMEEETPSGFFQALGVERNALESQLLPSSGATQHYPVHQLPLTPRLKNALERSGEEAQFFGQRNISPIHCVLGVLRAHESVGARTLRNAGVLLERARSVAAGFRP